MRLPWQPAPWFVASGDGVIQVRIPKYPRTAAEIAARDLRELLVTSADEPDTQELLRRIFPTAYPGHPGLDREYQRYMRSELLASHLSSLDTLERTLSQPTLTTADANAWLQSINAARVLCGTMLGVDHDGWSPDDVDLEGPDDVLGTVLALYQILGELLHELLMAMMGGDAQPDPDDPRLHPPSD